MIYLLTLLLGSAILYYVGQPLLYRKYRFAHLPTVGGDQNLQALQQIKNELLLAIKEIDFEFQMGKLAPLDYEKLKSEYQHKAMRVLQKIDDQKSRKSGKKDVEEEIRRFKLQHGSSTSQMIDIKYCPSCGNNNANGNRFCNHCGENLTQFTTEEN